MHQGKRLFITGIPTSGKSYLAGKLVREVGGVAVLLDDFREDLAAQDKYKKWVNFYLDQDEATYLAETGPDKMWQNLVAQSEALWPAFLAEINKYENEMRPVIFECVNILPHLAKRDLSFSGLVLVGRSYEETLARNLKEPRWGKTDDLQKLEAKMFWEVERPHYIAEAKKYGYPTYETADEAWETAVKLLA